MVKAFPQGFGAHRPTLCGARGNINHRMRFGNAAMDTLQEKQAELQLLRQHCAWFGMRGDLAMQRQLAMECDGIAVEIDRLQRGIGQSPDDPKAPL
jgi:hypothetical protein